MATIPLSKPWRRRNYPVASEVEARLVAGRVRWHVDEVHDGDPDACHCEHEYTIEGVTQWLGITDVDDVPLGVAVQEQPTIRGSFRPPKKGDR